ncbi:ABC transporter permease [Pseudonocardia dioxanivorans]|uniref:ABC transporter permease n=1 Tax=Pseudonocardia dioxanivorans TaxID=240495 RepID=UPI000CD26ABC|nr:ABC transporter permease [Pseudonocardia dioxanivorans]
MSNSLSDPEQVATVDPDVAPPRRRHRSNSPYTGIVLATCVLFVLSAILVPKSLSAESLGAMLPFWAILAIMSAGQTLVIQQRGIDLSIPGVVSLTAMGFVVFVDRNDTPVFVGLIVVVALGVVIGLVNGLIITRINVTPLITTLALNALLVGAMFSYTKGVGSAAPASLQAFAAARFLHVSVLVWLALGTIAVVGFVLRRTTVGRRFVAVGSNPDAARAIGLRVDAYIVGAYIAAALLFALAAVLLAGYAQNPAPTMGNPYLFQTVMAVVIGGTSLAGGRGSVVATAVAALFLTQLGQVVLTLGADAAVQLLVQAIAMALALAGAAWLNRRRGSGV